jgi:hypothetical protein
MPDPSLMECCGNPRVWHVHKADCPVRLRAIERSANAARAARHSHETRRAGVLKEHSGVIPLRGRNEHCPAHPSEPLYGCIVCSEVDA